MRRKTAALNIARERRDPVLPIRGPESGLASKRAGEFWVPVQFCVGQVSSCGPEWVLQLDSAGSPLSRALDSQRRPLS